MKPSEVLRGAADLIEPPGCWSRNWTAWKPDPQMPKDPTKRGYCLGTDPRADQWGGTGAIYAIGRRARLTDQECWAIQGIAARAVGADRFSDWLWVRENNRTQAEVVNALRQAAALAEAEGQ